MKYIELISKTKYGKMGFNHSVFQDGNIILSFENGVFIIYTKGYLTERIIKKVVDIPSFDLKQYEGRKETDYLCYEALDLIAKENGIQMDTILKRSKRITRWIILLLITHGIMFAWGYYGFTMSEEEFLLYKQDVCQE